MNNLLRLNGALRRDPKIEAWFGVGDPHRLMVREWFERMRACGPDARALRSPIHLPPVPHRHHQNHEPVVLDGGDDAVVADAIAP